MLRILVLGSFSTALFAGGSALAPSLSELREPRALHAKAEPPQISGRLHGARISPDGARVVFGADQASGGTVELYSMPLDGATGPVEVCGPISSSLGERWTLTS